MWINYRRLTYIETSNCMNEVKSYCMRVENIYPIYKSNRDREKSVQKIYEELQLIFYHKSQSEKNCFLIEKEQTVDEKKGN